jgi:UDP-N-acetylglucosamine transferase subunit ALG13
LGENERRHPCIRPDWSDSVHTRAYGICKKSLTRRILPLFIISHAGMGTIITGLIHSKPLVIMPRRYAFGEHRNEHQLGTADKFGHFDLIDIVHTDAELFSTIDCRLSSCSDPERQAIAVSDRLVDRIRSFIET